MKTYTIFSEASMYVKNADKIIGSLEGIQFNPKKFEGRLSIKRLDIKTEDLPKEFSVKIMKVDSKGNSSVLDINCIKLHDLAIKLNELIDFDCTEIIETNKGIPRVTTKVVGKTDKE